MSRCIMSNCRDPADSGGRAWCAYHAQLCDGDDVYVFARKLWDETQELKRDQEEAIQRGEANARQQASAEIEKLTEENAELADFYQDIGNELAKECEKSEALITARDTPSVIDFMESVKLEAWHQRNRWGTKHDGGKTDADWFWLVGYLAGKALLKPEKRLHHLVTTAAALANWHAASLGETDMRPGTDKPLTDILVAQICEHCNGVGETPPNGETCPHCKGGLVPTATSENFKVAK